MITREMIKNGFENNLISIEDEYNGCVSLCCRIGNEAFYFVGMEDSDLSTDEYWQSYTLDMGDVDTDLLEAMYFGKISDITVTTDEEEFGDVIAHDELWRAEREEGLKEFFRKYYEIDKDEEIHILQADGYKQVVDWKAVG